MWSPEKTKKKETEIKTLFNPLCDDLQIFLMNVEALSSKRGRDMAHKFLFHNRALLAVDESTTIKSRTATRTKNIIKLGKSTSYRRILTGSPVTKSPLDLYKQCEFLSPWLLNFQSFYAFRNRYAEMKTIHARGRSIQVVHKFQNIGELSDKLKGFSYRVLKEDCLDLPDKIYIKRNIALTSEQLKLYQQIKVSRFMEILIWK